MIKFEVKGDGYLLRGSPIDKATYEYFKDNKDFYKMGFLENII
jgi:hypothetical protein